MMNSISNVGHITNQRLAVLKSSDPMENGKVETMDANEYDLQVDEQADSLVDLKQKWVYFLITAATAIVAFSTKFALSYAKDFNRETLTPGGTVRWLVGAALFALLTVGFALLSIHLGHRSFEQHIRFRYKRTAPDPGELSKWDDLTKQQHFILNASCVCLFISTALSLCYFGFILW
ncbi:hypothetical protein ACPB9E_30640 [Streptomyces exfoliatus]|uniref:hypothetical protein n=1 Tax=Streptomyces exfoliatus TaxID=1905 RepID=UPI003C2CDF9C